MTAAEVDQDMYAAGWAAGTEGKGKNPRGIRSKAGQSWACGWNAGTEVRLVLRGLWKGGRLDLGHGCLIEFGGNRLPISKEGVAELLALGLVARGGNSPISSGWNWGQVTDKGLRLMGLPTKAEQRTPPQLVTGPDVRTAKRRGGKR